MHRCDVCEGFISDWLSLPLPVENAYAKHLRHKSMKRVSRSLATLLYDITMCISKEKLMDDTQRLIDLWTQEEDHMYQLNDWIEKNAVSLLQIHDTRSNIEQVRVMLEDNSCFKRTGDIEAWMGYCMFSLFQEVPNLHLEHTKQKPATGCGPSFGLRSFQVVAPPQRTQVSQIVLPGIPCIPSMPSLPSSPSTHSDSEDPPRIQIPPSFDLDELYS